MQTLPAAAMLAGREVLLVVATHLRRQPGNVVAPARQDLAHDGINTLSPMNYFCPRYRFLLTQMLPSQIKSEPDWLYRFRLCRQHHTVKK